MNARASGDERESPLLWLRSRKNRNGRPLIDDMQFEAGERLRADYGIAQMGPRVTAAWSCLAPCLAPQPRARRGVPAAEHRDAIIDARTRMQRALAAVGPEISGVLVDICCELKGLEEAEKQNGWPRRAGKVVLQIALTRLAKHYGLIADTCPSRRALRHWGETGYRPRIDIGPGEPSEAEA